MITFPPPQSVAHRTVGSARPTLLTLACDWLGFIKKKSGSFDLNLGNPSSVLRRQRILESQ